jgi:hypothetical protein
MTKTKTNPAPQSRLAIVLNFKILNFEFVSNFVLRASNLFTAISECSLILVAFGTDQYPSIKSCIHIFFKNTTKNTTNGVLTKIYGRVYDFLTPSRLKILNVIQCF